MYKVTGNLLESAYISELDLILLCNSLGRLAQLVEQLTLNQQVEGSSPSSLIQKTDYVVQVRPFCSVAITFTSGLFEIRCRISI